MNTKINLQDRARGMLVGLAIGDALGAPVEFLNSDIIAGEMRKIQKMHDTLRFPKGVWTDDTSMALCLADSLLNCGGYDSYDVMDKYVGWYDNGDWSYFNSGYGAGLQTQLALDSYKTNQELTDDQKTDSAGNGVIMRLAPAIIATANKPNLRLASISARDTHYSVTAEAVAEMFAATLYAALSGEDKEHIFAALNADFTLPEYRKVYEQAKPLFNRANNPKSDLLKDLGGYCIDTLTIALWGLKQFDRPFYGMLGVISLGGDTDTNAAVYGQLAGAYYGYNALPEDWRKNLYKESEIVRIADKLLNMGQCPILRTRQLN